MWERESGGYVNTRFDVPRHQYDVMVWLLTHRRIETGSTLQGMMFFLQRGTECTSVNVEEFEMVLGRSCWKTGRGTRCVVGDTQVCCVTVLGVVSPSWVFYHRPGCCVTVLGVVVMSNNQEARKETVGIRILPHTSAVTAPPSEEDPKTQIISISRNSSFKDCDTW